MYGNILSEKLLIFDLSSHLLQATRFTTHLIVCKATAMAAATTTTTTPTKILTYLSNFRFCLHTRQNTNSTKRKNEVKWNEYILICTYDVRCLSWAHAMFLMFFFYSSFSFSFRFVYKCIKLHGVRTPHIQCERQNCVCALFHVSSTIFGVIYLRNGNANKCIIRRYSVYQFLPPSAQYSLMYKYLFLFCCFY